MSPSRHDQTDPKSRSHIDAKSGFDPLNAPSHPDAIQARHVETQAHLDGVRAKRHAKEDENRNAPVDGSDVE